jgi:hypothetical protein
MWIALPMPMVPPVALLGLAFSQAISSLVSLAGKSLRPMIQSGPIDSMEIGSKSLR